MRERSSVEARLREGAKRGLLEAGGVGSDQESSVVLLILLNDRIFFLRDANTWPRGAKPCRQMRMPGRFSAVR
jgi:hypothetical protein